MLAMSLSQIASDVDGQLVGDASFTRVCIDTRALQKGDLFIAINGETFDANQFVTQAVELGAAGVVSSRKPQSDIPTLLVSDPRFVLGVIAKRNRRQLSGPLIGLTGSTGKTSCKDMLASILAEKSNVLATKGNFNNEVGVPLTLLAMNSEHQAAVIEMGACREGDIRYLCQFAEPTIAVVTNAMHAHIESFGDIETVASTKGEIFESLADDGVMVVNLDDRFASQWLAKAGSKKTMTFSESTHSADVFAESVCINADSNLEFVMCAAGSKERIELSLLGRHNVSNALAAAAAAIAAGASLQQVKKGLAKVRPTTGRLQSLYSPCGRRVIDDTYNANPGSVKAAIDVLVECSTATPASALSTCLILGTMAELGDQTALYHQEVAVYAKEQGVQKILAVGKYAAEIMMAFAGEGEGFDQMDDLLSALDKQLQADIVLVKGSRSGHMERVVEALMDNTDFVNKNLGEH
ncbi:MAG: UDP-N-acetylmuramoyl-tripeptide--D-alanyl-D-alanine ligase [Spongiibacteraceae bacterium]|nr:UDP-N-acetylmuramoyl-tripeptide--D-alanyl-D-alanine ligase [Spongiibacteraceae bacterium]